MNSPENTSTNTIEKNEVMQPNTETLEQADISVEDFSNFVNNEKEVFKNETLVEMGKVNNSIDLDQESFDKVKKESNIEADLKALDEEVENIIKKTKEEIRIEIIKNIEDDWKSKNGPTHRNLSKEEIEKNKLFSERFGEDWDGNTTALTEEYSNFYFGNNFVGNKNISVSGQADQILNEKFPEYEAISRGISVEEVIEERKNNALNEIKIAIEDRKRIRLMKGGENLGGYEEEQLIKKYIESGLLSKEEINEIEEKKGDKIEINKTNESQIENTEKSNNEIVSDLLEKNNLKFERTEFKENSIYTEAFLINKNENIEEKIVRVYRGIRELDTLFNQKPYPFRFEKYDHLTNEDKLKIDTAIDKLSTNTNYENLKEYIDIVSPYLNDWENNSLNSEIKFIEGSILDGHSCRRSLHQTQIAHPMGSSTFGLSPYLSTSYESKGTAAETAILVLDVPVSAMEDWGPKNDGESNLKGMLKKEYISAVILDNGKNNRNREMQKNEIISSLQKIEEYLPKVNKEEIFSLREQNHERIMNTDEQQASFDKRALEIYRVNKLFTKFEVSNEIKEYFNKYKNDQSVDVYKYVQNKIYEIYENRHDKINKNSLLKDDIDSDYQKEKINDEMLEKLKYYVERTEQRAEDRKK